MNRQSMEWLIPVLLAVGAAGALWYYWTTISQQPPEVVAEPTPVVVEPDVLPAPLHRLPDIASDTSPQPDLVSLPALDQSDEYFKLELASVFGAALEKFLVESGMIEKVVATVDSLPRAHVAEKIRPIGKLPDQFRIEGQEDAGNYAISESNYARYSALVDMLSSADVQEMTELYRRFYPLFQNAYENLGYPDGYFNDRLVAVIDHLLASPEPQGPVELTRPHVLFEYADKSLEELSSGQKMMIRMGDESSTKVKKVLRQVRQQITEL
jgi:hypothetical protein